MKEITQRLALQQLSSDVGSTASHLREARACCESAFISLTFRCSWRFAAEEHFLLHTEHISFFLEFPETETKYHQHLKEEVLRKNVNISTEPMTFHRSFDWHKTFTFVSHLQSTPYQELSVGVQQTSHRWNVNEENQNNKEKSLSNRCYHTPPIPQEECNSQLRTAHLAAEQFISSRNTGGSAAVTKKISNLSQNISCFCLFRKH